MEKAKRGRKRTNIWTVPGLEKRVQMLIQESILTKKDGEDAIIKTVTEEFGEQLAANGLRLTKKALAKRLIDLVFTKKVEADLWRFHANKMMPRFRELYSWIPEQLISKREKELKGVTHTKSVAQFKAGMGRLNIDSLPPGAEAYEFPAISFQEPFVVSKESEGQLVLINGALVGIKYPDIKRNTLRRGLADARKRGAACVVLTNLMDLWTKKTAGFLAVYRAMVSGIGINPDRFPANYRQEVREILDGTITDKMIYQTLNERFEEIVDGLHKITHRKDATPEFPGPVYLLLGFKEEELINAAAYYEARYRTIVEQNKIEAELNAASSKLQKAKNQHNQRDIAFWSAEVARLGERKARAIITNHTGVQYEQLRRRMRAYVVKRLEETIPNAKILSQGSTYLKVSDKVIKLQVSSSDTVTDGHLADLGDSYGADVFRDTLADLTISCPAYSLNHRDVGREDSKDGRPVTKFLAVAPSALDGEYLRGVFKDITKSQHPVLDLVRDPQFQPGVLLVTWGSYGVDTHSLPIEKLDMCEAVENFAFPYPGVKYITWFLNTDNHFGAPDKRYIWDPKDRIHRGTAEAVIEMMRRAGVVNPRDVRIHCTAEMDDATNGDMWFNPRYRPDPNEMSIIHVERWLRQMTNDLQRASDKGDSQAVRQLAEEINKISIAQLYFRGEDFPFHQMMQVYDRHIAPNVDFYSAVLGRFVKSGLVMRGISKINRTMSDTRDLAVHNFPNGNHRIKTLDQKDLEGDYIARHLQEMLKQRPEWQKFLRDNPKRTDFFEEAIRAPRFGNETFGWGTLQAPGGYPWGFRVHGSPARQNSWSDVLAAVIRSDIARGDDTYGLLKTVTVTFYGDKHFHAKAQTERIVYVMCAAGVHTNLYGSSGGFPPNNTGVCFVSVPAGGPTEGPIVVRRISHDLLRDWFANPKTFDWEKFLPEPV